MQMVFVFASLCSLVKDTCRNGQPTKSQLSKKLTQTENDQEAMVDVFRS
jgi:hypothetical protein